MKLRIVFVILIASITTTQGLHMATSYAQDASLNKAREHFDKAQALYAKKQYKEAAKEFQSAYDARPFAQFLFNIGACQEKLGNYAKAVELYKRYLKDEPNAQDRVAVKKRITVLEKEAKRIKTTTSTQPSSQPTKVKPSAEVVALGEAKIRGLVVIESDPAGANIYLDSKKSKPLAKTPWSGSLEGTHTIYLEKKGYEEKTTKITPHPEKLLVMYFGLAKQDYLGWLTIRSNIPGADIYMDDKKFGVYRKTPFSGNVKPGKHKVWITKLGYDEVYKEIEIIRGKTHEIMANLKGSPVGYLNIRGSNTSRTSVWVDGKLFCKRGPCLKPLKEGIHKVAVKRGGYKSFNRTIDVQAKTEVTLRAKLAKRPGRGDAIAAYIFAAAFAGGGVYLGLEAKKIQDDLRAEIDAGNPPPDSNDPRLDKGKIFSWAANAAYGLGGISFLTAVYYTFRDKGKPSTGRIDVRAMAVRPYVTPTVAGLGIGGMF